jgi:hypothetical protein
MSFPRKRWYWVALFVLWGALSIGFAIQGRYPLTALALLFAAAGLINAIRISIRHRL